MMRAKDKGQGGTGTGISGGQWASHDSVRDEQAVDLAGANEYIIDDPGYGQEIRNQIEMGSLMSLGASNVRVGKDNVKFDARILGYNKDGSRSGRPSKMEVEVKLNAMDYYDVTIRDGERVHGHMRDVDVSNLNRVLIAADSDTDSPFNPRYVPNPYGDMADAPEPPTDPNWAKMERVPEGVEVENDYNHATPVVAQYGKWVDGDHHEYLEHSDGVRFHIRQGEIVGDRSVHEYSHGTQWRLEKRPDGSLSEETILDRSRTIRWRNADGSIGSRSTTITDDGTWYSTIYNGHEATGGRRPAKVSFEWVEMDPSTGKVTITDGRRRKEVYYPNRTNSMDAYDQWLADL